MIDPNLTRAADNAAAKIKKGWSFRQAVGTASRENNIAFETIAGELSARSVAHRRAETINHSTPAPETPPRAAQAPKPSSLFDDAPAQNDYGVL